MFPVGFSDIGGVIHELDPSDKDPSKPHARRENTNAGVKRTRSEHLSTSPMSSIQEGVHPWDHALDGGERVTVTTAMTMTF